MLSKGHTLKNRFVIQEELGNGLAGSTYLAVDTRVENRWCAIKELDPPEHRRNSPEYKVIRKKFQEETRCLKELEGYNGRIPELLASFSENDTLYIVQEYIEGDTLRERIKAAKIDQSRVKDLLVDLLDTINYIHSRGIIHRDITPANIMLRKGSEIPVLIDFGAIKDIDITQIGGTIQNTEFVFYKKGYTAPEQYSGESLPASDIYSLGKSVIHALSGMHPQIISETGLAWRSQVNGILPEFADLINKSVEPYLTQRYKNAKDMLSDLNAIVFPADAEKIAGHLGKQLAIPEREPKPFSWSYQKCGSSWSYRKRSSSCDYIVTIEDMFCPICAETNNLYLEHKRKLLFKEAEQYFEENILPRMDTNDQLLIDTSKYSEIPQYLLFVQKKYKEEGKWSIFLDKRKIEAIFILPVIVFWFGFVFILVSRLDFHMNAYWLIPVIILVAITLGGFEILTNFYWYRQIDKLRKRRRNLTDKKRRTLENIVRDKESLQQPSHTDIAIDFRPAILRTEGHITNRISELSEWEKDLTRLSGEIEDERRLNSRIRERFNSLIEKKRISEFLQGQYHSKKKEIELIRHNNSLQTEIRVDQMTYGQRVDIKEKLKKIIEICNQIIADMRAEDIEGASWMDDRLARILEISRIAGKLRDILLDQEIELALPGRSSDTSVPTHEFADNAALLNAYVGIGDFYTEFELLEKEFANAKV